MEIKTWNDAREQLQEFAALEAQRRKLAARREAKRLEVEVQFAAELEALQKAQSGLASALKKFAAARKPDFKAKEEGGEGRTRVIFGVEIGFSLGPPYIKILKKKAEEALVWLEEFAGDIYVRRAPEFAKDKLKADLLAAQAARDQAFIDKLAGRGITLEQDDDFVLKVTEN